MFFVLFSLSVIAQSNDLRIENGVYYNMNGTLFNGQYSQYDAGVKVAELNVEN